MATSGFPKQKGGRFRPIRQVQPCHLLLTYFYLAREVSMLFIWVPREFTSVPVNLRLNFGTVQTV